MKDETILIIFLSTLYSSSYGRSCFGTSNGLSTSGTQHDQLRRLKELYQYCTKVVGNLEIVNLPSDPNIDLSFLHDIREVTGHIFIYGIHAKSLPLPMLELIAGRDLYSLEITDPETNKKVTAHISVLIANNKNLVELGLNSLTKIAAGDVIINSNNADLCYKVLWNETLSNVKSRVFADPIPASCSCHVTCPKFKDKYCWGPGKDHCQKWLTKKVCNKECDESGCSGPLDSQCFKCKSYNQGNRCVPSCELGWFDDKSGKSCGKCHEQCLGCLGKSSIECIKCRYLKYYLNNKNKEFDCTKTCPSLLPHQSSEDVDGSIIPICVANIHNQRSRIDQAKAPTKPGLTASIIVGAAFACIFLVAIAVILKKIFNKS